MSKLTKADLQQFTGSETFYRHVFNRAVVYTEGVKFLAEQAKAHWLIDSIALLIGSHRFNAAAAKDERIGLIHFWKLAVGNNQTAKLEARADSPDEPFISENIFWTDFPLDEADIWAAHDGDHWTLMLPSEY
ncbi:MAG: hypothetical protein KDA84_19655 [Planctomycetaceae bacterium]|nr:hypothetical protein [Planctomycetaceae bacterium]